MFAMAGLSIYWISFIPLAVVTTILAFLTRPKAIETREGEGEESGSFRRFQRVYLVVWYVCVASDWLQGPYVYELYSMYGFSRHEIAELFVAGFASSMVFGTFAGSMADKIGRKQCCMWYCVFYILSCMTKHVDHYWVLMIGRLTGGVATSLLFSCFESWMVSEATVRRCLSGDQLRNTFSYMWFGNYLVAICCGLFSQAMVNATTFGPVSPGSKFYTGGPVVPFDMAIGFLVVGLVLIVFLWEENHGSSSQTLATQEEDLAEPWWRPSRSLRAALNSPHVLAAGLAVSMFEAAMFAFVFNWTPALKQLDSAAPLGFIFAMFMMAAMCGSSLFELMPSRVPPKATAVTCMILGAGSFSVLLVQMGASTTALAMLWTFLVFEMAVGAYFPSMGTLKSQIVPEPVRATVYNLYRVPLNGLVLVVLLNNFSLATAFSICAALCAGAGGVLLLASLAPAKDLVADDARALREADV